MDDKLKEALDKFNAIDWGPFDTAYAEFKEAFARRTCWYCAKAMGQNDGLFLDGVWEVHPECARPAQNLSGRQIKMAPDK